MKTLIVTYLPSGERSWTGKALEAFLNKAQLTDVDCVDLCLEEPCFISPAFISNYLKRNYGGEQLTPEETMVMEQADTACEKLCACDVLVMAFPLFNFSLPGSVKAWFDMVMQFNKTWTIDQPGNHYRGYLTGKKVVVFMASGGTYDEEPAKSMDHAEPLTRLLLGFLGFETIEFVRVQGTSGRVGTAEANLATAKEKGETLALKWYAQE